MPTDHTSSRSAKHAAHGKAYSEANKPVKSKPGPKKKKRLLLKIFLSIVAVGMLCFLAGVALFWSYASKAPALEDGKLNASVSSKIYDINNEVIEDLGAEKRVLIQPKNVPQLLKDAIVSVEDRRFYKHVGVDPIRIIGSALSNIKTGGLQGGSTLTQQLIKLSYFSTKESDQTLKRKAQEAWLALQLERKKSKEEIITYYINKVYMANGLYGMETAAENYYGKPLSKLNLPQTALLAGMPQAPNDYDPYTKPKTAKERRDVVLYTMLDNKKITKEQYDQAKATPVNDGLVPLKASSDNRKIVDNYITEVIKEVAEKTGKNVETDGMNIYTNLDMNAQKRLYDIVNSNQYVTYPDADFQVASTVIDVNTGQVRAQIGGRNIPDNVQRGENLAVNVRRDVGSTMKPIIDYGPAIENLNYSTGKLLYDHPVTFPGTNTQVYNADLNYMGYITMRTALKYSRNTTAVQTFEAVGKEKIEPFINGLGVQFKNLEFANAISSNTNDIDGTKYGVSSLKLAAAYAAFANNGVYNKPYYVNKIVYNDGSQVEFKPDSKRAMKDSTAYMITDMLKDVVKGGTAFNAAIPGLYQAAKTGTSNYTDQDLANMGTTEKGIAPDSTFVGYTPHYAVSVWTGYKNRNTPVHEEQYGIASDVYREMMTFLAQSVSNEDWQQPDSVVRVGKELYVKDAYDVPTVPSTDSTDSYSSTVETPNVAPSSTSDPAAGNDHSTSSSSALPSSTQSSVTPSSTSSESVEPSSSEPPQPSSSDTTPTNSKPN
ncbi:PBP1A family penicillin-binding protein [Enterococcus faecalis]